MAKENCTYPNCENESISFSPFCGKHTNNRELKKTISNIHENDLTDIFWDEVEIKKINRCNFSKYIIIFTKTLPIMPKCTKCSAQPEMVFVKSGKVLGMEKPPRGGLSPSYKHKHPATAIAVGVLKGIAWLDNKVDLDTYECPNCGAKKKKLDTSRL